MTRQNADRRSANAQSVITDNGVAKGRLGKLRARSQSLNSSSTAIAELPQPHSYLWIMCKQGKIRFFISKSSWERHLSDGPVKHDWLVVYLFCFTLLPTTTATLSHSQFQKESSDAISAKWWRFALMDWYGAKFIFADYKPECRNSIFHELRQQ